MIAALGHAISLAMACVLVPLVGACVLYVAWHLVEMIPAVRNWLDFRGVDVGTPGDGRVRGRIEPVHPPVALPPRPVLALTAGAQPADDPTPAAEVA